MMRFAVFLTMLLIPSLALAHTGIASHEHAGFLAGLAHPLTGADHLAAMLAVGLWAVSLSGRALWLVPASFVALLAAGAVLGGFGLALPAVEPMIALSVVALGLAAAVRVQAPVAAAAALVGGFALFHGQAHGAEMPALASPLLYGAGFVVATAALHAAGIVLGRTAWLGRTVGPAIAGYGLLLLAV
jgi:urease accessory protein